MSDRLPISPKYITTTTMIDPRLEPPEPEYPIMSGPITNRYVDFSFTDTDGTHYVILHDNNGNPTIYSHSPKKL